MSGKISVRENNENLLFRRKELKIDVEMDITPSREEAKKIVCDTISCVPEVVRVIKVEGKFGEKVFTIIADVYNSIEDIKEYAPVLKKKDIELEKKIAEAEAVAKVETETPKEELKEEVSVEATTEEKHVEEKSAAEEKPVETSVEEKTEEVLVEEKKEKVE